MYFITFYTYLNFIDEGKWSKITAEFLLFHLFPVAYTQLLPLPRQSVIKSRSYMSQGWINPMHSQGWPWLPSDPISTCMLGTKPRSLCMSNKHCSNWATSLAHQWLLLMKQWTMNWFTKLLFYAHRYACAYVSTAYVHVCKCMQLRTPMD